MSTNNFSGGSPFKFKAMLAHCVSKQGAAPVFGSCSSKLEKSTEGFATVTLVGVPFLGWN